LEGELVRDEHVLLALFSKLTHPRYENKSVLVDGAPRTRRQMEGVAYFYEKARSFGVPLDLQFLALYCTEEESVERQLYRGREIKEYNRKVKESGNGELREERITDDHEHIARKRYLEYMEKTHACFTSSHSFFPHSQTTVINGKKKIISSFLSHSLLFLPNLTSERESWEY